MKKIIEFVRKCNVFGFYTNNSNDELHIGLFSNQSSDDIINGILNINSDCEIEICDYGLIVRNKNWI